MIKAFAILLFLAQGAWASDPTTSRLGGLVVPIVGTYNWGPKVNGDIWQISSNTCSQIDPNTFYSSNTFLFPILLSGASIYLTGPNGYINSQSSITSNGFYGPIFGDISKASGFPPQNGSQLIYYLTSIPSGVSDYMLWTSSPSLNTETTVSKTVASNNTDVIISTMISPIGSPGTNFIPAGVWELELWSAANVTNSNPFIRLDLYIRTSGGSEFLLATATGPAITSSGSAGSQTITFTTQVSTTIATDSRIVGKFYGRKTAGASTTITIYREGSAHQSHIHTPLPESIGFPMSGDTTGYFPAPVVLSASGSNGFIVKSTVTVLGQDSNGISVFTSTSIKTNGCIIFPGGTQCGPAAAGAWSGGTVSAPSTFTAAVSFLSTPTINTIPITGFSASTWVVAPNGDISVNIAKFSCLASTLTFTLAGNALGLMYMTGSESSATSTQASIDYALMVDGTYVIGTELGSADSNVNRQFSLLRPYLFTSGTHTICPAFQRGNGINYTILSRGAASNYEFGYGVIFP